MAMVVREPGTCAAMCQSISSTASNVAQWMGKTVRSGCSTIANFASKTATLAKPHFENLGGFVRINKGPIVLAAVVASAGVLLVAAINAFFCSKTAGNGAADGV